MARKKDPMALFEVLSKSQNPRNTMHVPDWAKRKVDQAAETEDASAETDDAEQPLVVDADAVEIYESDPVASAAPATPEKLSKYQKGATFLQKLAARREAAKAEQPPGPQETTDVVEDVAEKMDATTPPDEATAEDAVDLAMAVEETTTEELAEPDPGDTEIGVSAFLEDEDVSEQETAELEQDVAVEHDAVEAEEPPVIKSADRAVAGQAAKTDPVSGLFVTESSEHPDVAEELDATTEAGDESAAEPAALSEVHPREDVDAGDAEADRTEAATDEDDLAEAAPDEKESTAVDASAAEENQAGARKPSPIVADEPFATVSEGLFAASLAKLAPWRPRVHLHEDEVEITVRLIPAMFALGTVLVLMVLTFVLGRVTAPRDATPPSSPVRQAAAPEDAGPAEAEAQEQPAIAGLNPLSTDPPVLSPPKQRDPGRNYLVIQMLGGADDVDYDEAMRIQSFMDEQGVPVDAWTVNVNGKPRLMVWSRLGFESPTSREAEALVDRVERLGKQYFQKYQTYDFRQRVDGRRRPFFVRGDKVNPKQEQS